MGDLRHVPPPQSLFRDDVMVITFQGIKYSRTPCKSQHRASWASLRAVSAWWMALTTNIFDGLWVWDGVGCGKPLSFPSLPVVSSPKHLPRIFTTPCLHSECPPSSYPVLPLWAARCTSHMMWGALANQTKERRGHECQRALCIKEKALYI